AAGTARSAAAAPARPDAAAEPAPPRRLAPAVAVLLLAASASVAAVLAHIPPPVYFVPTSIAQNFLGFELPGPLTLAALALQWRVNILFLVMAVLGVTVYLAAVIRLRRRGDRWPAGRTVAWVLGWLVAVVTTSSGVGRYSGGSFAVHMGLHMSMNMLVPTLLVLGGVVTLLLRATRGHRPAEPAGAHEWITAMMHAPLLRLAYHPLYVFVIFIASYYVLYFTPIFEFAMRYHWAHQLMTVHYLVVGYLFYSVVIGVDPPPRPLPHIGKLGIVLAAMPFHAFFGVIVMTTDTIIAQTYYQYLDSSWLASLADDQYTAGGIAWSAGELPLVVVVVALIVQWGRQDARLARRTDRHLDSGLDQSYEAYNAMLARLSRRDGPRQPAEPSELAGELAGDVLPSDARQARP
ncbi:MAG: cytochrome c oxidase assembly protein, partial [Microbacteriaceae bacterium]